MDNAQAYEEIERLNRKLSEETEYYKAQHVALVDFDDFVGASSAIKKVLTDVESVAKTDANVLILGETGVGKEMVAQAVHRHSLRNSKPFIAAQCSTFPRELVSSELFGHEKGSFTGAEERRIGRFELANGGTVFLDEIGDISLEVQVRLLRVLQSHTFERVGGRKTIHSDFRLVAATNRNLVELVKNGEFRSDLYYRLNVFCILVPPLRERKEDIPVLAEFFLEKYAKNLGKSFKGISQKDMEKLINYSWPGNVRELENVIERGSILNSGPSFNLPELMVKQNDSTITFKGQSLREVEKRQIISTLQTTGWKVYGKGGAAEILEINHNTLYSKIKKYGIKRPDE